MEKIKFNEYLKVKAAAEYLGCTKNTLRNWEKQGKIIVFRHPVNKYRLYNRLDLDNMLSAKE